METQDLITFLLEQEPKDSDDQRTVQMKQAVRYAIKVERDCRYYLAEHPQFDQVPMYRGVKSGAPTYEKPINQRKIRKNRAPLDTEPFIHHLFDERFEQLFGFRARSQGVAVTGSYKIASEYATGIASSPNIVFPIGTFFWIAPEKKVKDLQRIFTTMFLEALIKVIHKPTHQDRKMLKSAPPIPNKEIFAREILFRVRNKDKQVYENYKEYLVKAADLAIERAGLKADVNLSKALTDGSEINIGGTDYYYIVNNYWYIDVDFGSIVKDIYKGNVEKYIHLTT